MPVLTTQSPIHPGYMLKSSGTFGAAESVITEANLLNALGVGAVFNVKDYGAKGDGSTDDASAIQAAVDAVPAAGGTVYFPAGTYILKSAWITLKRSNTVVCGDGLLVSTIKSTRVPTSYPATPADGLYGLFNAFGLSGLVFRDLGFIGTCPTQTTLWDSTADYPFEKAIYVTSISAANAHTFTSYTDILISRCRAQQMCNEAFYADADDTVTPICDRIEISDCEAYGCAISPFNVNCTNGNGVQTCKILRNKQYGCGYGIQAGGKLTIIKDNFASDTWLSAVKTGTDWILTVASLFEVSGDVADGLLRGTAGVSVIQLGLKSREPGNTYAMSGVVQGNTVKNCKLCGSTNLPGAINVDCTGGPVRITNNTIFGNSWPTGGAGDPSVPPYVAGISVMSSVTATTDVLIDHNCVYTGGQATQDTGVRIASGITTNLIRVVGNSLLVATPRCFNSVAPKLDIYNIDTTTTTP